MHEESGKKKRVSLSNLDAVCMEAGALVPYRPRSLSRPLAVVCRVPPTSWRAVRSAAMHSFWQRLNAIFFFALSVLGFLSFLGAGMTYWHVSTPRIELTLEKIVLRKIYGAGAR